MSTLTLAILLLVFLLLGFVFGFVTGIMFSLYRIEKGKKNENNRNELR